MGAGRPPTPGALRQLSGSHPERLNRHEAKFRSAESAIVPKHVSSDPHAKEEWDRVVPELTANGLLTRANLMIFANYCKAYAHMMEAEEDLAARGRTIFETVFDKKGNDVGTREKPNPAIAQVGTFMQLMTRLSSEFGLTPAAATRVKAEPGAEKKSSFGEFMGGEDDAELPAAGPN